MRIIMPSTTDTDTDSDVALIVRAVLRVARRLRVETPSEVFSGGALGLLATLHRAGSMPAVALAAEEGLAPQSLTRLLQQLEDKAMIERTPDPQDGRAKIISITVRGRQSLRWAMKERRKWLAEAIDERLNDDEREQLVEAAQLLLRLAI
jgi:DNA-binding MarR family transcriptional regulator